MKDPLIKIPILALFALVAILSYMSGHKLGWQEGLSEDYRAGWKAAFDLNWSSEFGAYNEGREETEWYCEELYRANENLPL